MCWLGIVGTQSWIAAWPFIALGLVFKVAMWAAIATLVVYAIRWLRRERHLASPMTPLEILKTRYARGELSKQDFESMRRDVDG
jgi:putative membrane protein